MIDFDDLPTAAVADAVVRLGHALRHAPPTIRRLVPGYPIAGRAVPVRHFGSVDVFLEALEGTPPGGLLVIDNGGRDDEACIGDLTVAEVKLAGLTGIVLWGFHRDQSALAEIGLPIWSRGCLPPGPRSARPRDDDPLAWADVGGVRVDPGDVVVADDDGVVFVAADLWSEVSATAAEIVAKESHQAGLVLAGTALRSQLGFADYLARRRDDPSYTLRQHLAERGGAIET